MRIALIYPRLNYNIDFVGNDGYVKNMSGYPPLSLAYVAAIIKSAGHEVTIIDGNISNLSLDDTAEKIKAFQPDLLGLTVTIATFPEVCNWIRSIKKYVDMPVVIGGPSLDLYIREFMLHKEVDYALCGAVSDSLPKFLDVFKENNADYLAGIPGLCFRKGNELIINQAEYLVDDIGKLPFPSRELLANNKYFSPFSEKKNFTPFITAKGCFFRCAYCCLVEKPHLREVKDVLAELKECYFRFKIRDIDFYDPVFTIDKQRALGICRGIRDEGISIRWSARTHINHIDEELLEEMASSGCRMIMYGIESTDKKILLNLNRDFIEPERVKHIVNLTRKHGIIAFGFFMLGAPGETIATMKNTIKFSKEAGLDFAQFTRVIAIPGTKLYERYLSEHGKDYWRQLALGGEPEEVLLAVGTDLPPEVIVRYVKQGNLGFYLRPKQALRVLLNASSLLQLMNFVKAGANMLIFFFLSLVFKNMAKNKFNLRKYSEL